MNNSSLEHNIQYPEWILLKQIICENEQTYASVLLLILILIVLAVRLVFRKYAALSRTQH